MRVCACGVLVCERWEGLWAVLASPAAAVPNPHAPAKKPPAWLRVANAFGNEYLHLDGGE